MWQAPAKQDPWDILMKSSLALTLTTAVAFAYIVMEKYRPTYGLCELNTRRKLWPHGLVYKLYIILVAYSFFYWV